MGVLQYSINRAFRDSTFTRYTFDVCLAKARDVNRNVSYTLYQSSALCVC
jgi:hypothetical protein